MELFFAGIILFIAGGVLSEFVSFRYKPAVSLIFSVPGTIFTGYAALLSLTGRCTPEITFMMNFPFGETRFVMDSLSSLFVFIFSVVYLPVSIYSSGIPETLQQRQKRETALHIAFASDFIDDACCYGYKFNHVPCFMGDNVSLFILSCIF